MKTVDKLPPCRPDHEHHFSKLGRKDDGTEVSRCGTCMTEKHEKDAVTTYRVPDEVDHRLQPRFHELNTRAAQKAKAKAAEKK